MVTSNGTLPVSGTLAVAAEGTAAEYVPPILERLQARGLSVAKEADYLVQVAIADRPRGSGLYLPDQPRMWLRSPARATAKGSAPTLVVTLSERGSGRELYRASAVAPSKSAAKPEALVASMLSEGAVRK